MKLVFKFFMWRIKIKTEKLDAEDKVKFLANELIKATQDCGFNIQHKHIQKGFCSLEIKVYHGGTEKATMEICNILNDWKIETKPTFNLLEVE